MPQASVVRIGNLLDDPAEHQQQPPFRAGRNLASVIFNTHLDDDDLLEYYIQTAPHPMERVGTVEPAPDPRANLGEYERQLLGRLHRLDDRVVPIVGGMGSGKTTVIRFLIDRLKSTPCSEACSNGESCNGHRLIAYLDFDKRPYPKAIGEEKAEALLYTDLCRILRAKLNLKGLPQANKEFSDFWSEELNKVDQEHVQSTAFATIAERLDLQGVPAAQALTGAAQISDDEIKHRKDLLKEVSADPEAHLDYLVRLWGFVAREHFGEYGDCAMVILDNLDGQEPLVQTALMSIVAACARDAGPTFVIPLRPETLERNYDAANAPEPEEHVAPRPHQVVMDRLCRFSEKPELYYDVGSGIRREEFDIIAEYLSNLYRELQGSQASNSHYLDFLDDACGDSLRLALMLAKRLLALSQHTMQTRDYSQHTLVRFTIRKPGGQYDARDRVALANLFHVRNVQSRSRLTAKLRILRYLKLAGEDQTRTLSNMAATMYGFGYERTTVTRQALNEMLRPWCQLIRSNTRDAFSESDMTDPGGQAIKLSPIGDGYLENLAKNIDYVQEVMLDCYVGPSVVGTSVPYTHLSDKLDLLYRFLNEIRRADEAETRTYMKREGRMKYLELFGERLLFFDFILAMRNSMDGLADYMIGRDRVPSQPYTQVKENMWNLLLWAAEANFRILGIQPPVKRDSG